MKNLTPHAITIQTEAGTIVFQPSGTVARVETEEVEMKPIMKYDIDIPVVDRKIGNVVGLPPAGELCIVSSMVLSAIPGRVGVYAPDTGTTAIRDEKGHIVAVTRLVEA